MFHIILISLKQIFETEKMCEKWRGKNAIVTGASSGIGSAIMKDLACKGINVIALARRKEKIEEIVEKFAETDGKIHPHKCDVSDTKSISETIEWIEKMFGCVHILINNAGVNFNVKILDEGDEVTDKLEKTVSTNFTGLVHITRAIVSLMRKSNDYSIIININSTAGHYVPFINHAWNLYPSTKFALTAFSEVLRQELIVQKLDKIRVTNLSPGVTKTDIAVAGGFMTDQSNSTLDDSPRLKPEDVAHAVVYILDTHYNVNITELTIKPVSERL